MDKLVDSGNVSHIVKLSDRKSIIISGICKINNFDDKEFSLDSVMGGILIKGEGLEMVKLDTIEGNVSIKGKINSVIYTDNVSRDNGILMKLFK